MPIEARSWTGSPWWNTSGKTRFPPLDRPIDTDVAVIGGGITGLTAAWRLAKGGKRVVVFERFAVGAGSTGDSTGHLTACLDQPYHDLERTWGKEKLRSVAQSSMAAIQFIESTTSELAIQCDFARVPGFRFTRSAKAVSSLRREAKLMSDLGLDVSFGRSTPLPFPVKGALRLENQAQFDAPKYCRALAAAVEKRGGLVFGDTGVDSIDGGRRPAIRAGGHRVTADSVIMATHTPLNRVLALQNRLSPFTTYTLACSLGSYPVPEGLFWDTEDPYHYLRGVLDRGRRLLLLGGEDHPTGREPDTRKRLDALEKYARKNFDVRSIAYHGSGQVLNSADGLPFIGRVPGMSGEVYVATGYSGTGLTFGTVAGRILSELAMGRRLDPWAEVYYPSRERLAPLKGSSAKPESSAHRVRSDPSSHPEISPGEGKVVALGGEKVAIYRDPRGALHRLSPACTHMGCTVRWNAVARTWDCPCHGGRYRPTGEVISGPPTHELQHLPVVSAGRGPRSER